jgi:AraC-like DNA-binding protein
VRNRGVLPRERATRADLIAEIARCAPRVGPNESEWPGLTLYRFTSSVSPHWDAVRSLSLCVVVQGQKRVTVGDRSYDYDPFHYLVLSRGMRFQAEILEACREKPFLSFVLQVDPGIVKRISSEMAETAGRCSATFGREIEVVPAGPYISPVDRNLAGAVLRFLGAIKLGQDRRILAPTYVNEIVYRILQDAQARRLAEAAAAECDTNPIAKAITYIQERISQPITVNDIAEFVCMSRSAFAHQFREVTGSAPYQFVKQSRLLQAQKMLAEGDVSITEVAHRVGYTSLPHFINEFKRHFGVTPRTYAQARRSRVALDVERATTPG